MRSGAEDASHLTFGLLGDFTATRDGQALDLGGRRQRAVLVLLLLARGEVKPADQLIDALWGEAAPPSATGALQAYVSHLRNRLEPGRTARSRRNVIASRGNGYALVVPDDAVDAWRFERLVRHAGTLTRPADGAAALARALGLWRGPALADYAEEPWAHADAVRLTELRAVARERLLAARLDAGEVAAVLVPELEALVSEQPLREERWRLLVLALYRAHRQGDALAALRRARTTLADELGVDPGPALRALEIEVLEQSPALQAPPVAVAPVPSGRPSAPSAPTVPTAPSDDLVDRERELAELRLSLDEMLAGQARLVLVEGPAGIGKTRLLTEGRRLASNSGTLTLTARGSQLEKEYAFGAVRQLFEPALADAAMRTDALSGAAASARSVFDIDAAEADQRADGSLAVLHGLYWLTVNLATNQALTLAVDDLQWCDTGSLRFLAYLVRRIEGLSILIIATIRTGEPHDDAALLAELAHDPATVQIRPSPLTPEGAAVVVRRRLGGAAEDVFVGACHRTTSGNPLLLRQLLRALQAEGVRPDALHADTVTAIGSRAISSMVLMRLSRMPGESTAAARAIAVLGNGAPLPAVAALAGLSEDRAAAVIAALARAEVLRDEYPLSFVHPLVADAVYRDLPPGERQLHHERAARVLHESGAPVDHVAAHLLQVPHRGDRWVVDVLRSAAARATDRGAPDVATTYLTRALAEPPGATDRPTVVWELGRVETLSNGTAAIEHLRDAYHTHADPTVRAIAAQMLARTLTFASGRGEATTFARRAVAELPADLVDARQGLVALERMSGYMHGLHPSQWAGDEQPTIVGEGHGARMLASALAWELLTAGRDRPGAVALARFAIADRTLMDVDNGLFWVAAANVLQLADEQIDAFWEEALAFAYQRGSMFTSLSVNLWGGYLKWRRGELREAHHALMTASEQLRLWGGNVTTNYIDAIVVHALLDLGDVAEARAFVAGHRDEVRAADSGRTFHEACARLLLAEGHPADALGAIDHAQRLHPAGDNPVWWPWRSVRAQALAALGRTAEAVSLVEDELVAARRWGAPSLVGRTLRLLGELRGPAGVAELREAVSVLSSSFTRLELGRAQFALGRHTPRDEAVPLLRAAYDSARWCGAEPLVRSASSALRALGVTVATGPAELTLTTTERRIAAMADDGADERQIAQALFLTPLSVRMTLADVRARQAS